MSSDTSFLEASYAFGSSPQKHPFDSATPPAFRKFHLFGYPIQHSLAPYLHNTVFRSLDLPWTYEVNESLDREHFLSLLRDEECIGSAITMPHKVSMMPHVDELTEEGKIIGAINTVFVRLVDDNDGKKMRKKYVGTNTDCVGIRDAFVKNYPDVLEYSKGKPAMVLGGGGACRSAVYACWKWMGASKIYIVNRLKSEVDDIISSFTSHKEFDGEIIHVETVQQAKECERPVIIVGTVPDIPPKEDGEIRAREVSEVMTGKLKDEAEQSRKGYVLEMCYHPKPRTAFYDICEKAGWDVIVGTEAMIYQGIAQDVLWTERPVEDFEKAIEEAKKLIQEKLVIQEKFAGNGH